MKKSQDTFLTLLESHKGIIYKIANSYCADKDDREDIIQEIIEQLWTSFENYDSKFKQSTWVYRIALNTAISFYRKSRPHKENTRSLTPIIESSLKDDNPLENPDLKVLKQFIKQLKAIDKSLILLYLDGNKYQDIADITGFTLTNVSSRISRIKKELKIKFESIKHE